MRRSGKNMRHTLLHIAVLTLLILVTSCSERPLDTMPELSSAGLVVVSHTAHGELIDFLVLDDLGEVEMIRVTPKQESIEVHVTLYGRNRHKELQRDVSVFSMVAEGYKGCVEVSVQNGMAVGSFGNGINTPSPVSEEALRTVCDGIAQRVLDSGSNTTIHIIKKTASLREGMPPLPVPLTQEMDDQLVKEGILPPKEN